MYLGIVSFASGGNLLGQTVVASSYLSSAAVWKSMKSRWIVNVPGARVMVALSTSAFTSVGKSTMAISARARSTSKLKVVLAMLAVYGPFGGMLMMSQYAHEPSEKITWKRTFWGLFGMKSLVIKCETVPVRNGVPSLPSETFSMLLPSLVFPL